MGREQKLNEAKREMYDAEMKAYHEERTIRVFRRVEGEDECNDFSSAEIGPCGWDVGPSGELVIMIRTEVGIVPIRTYAPGEWVGVEVLEMPPLRKSLGSLVVAGDGDIRMVQATKEVH